NDRRADVEYRGEENRVYKRRQDHAEDNDLHGEKTGEAKLAPEQDRMAHVDEPGLHPPFEPADALRQPFAEPLRRILERRVADDADLIAVAGKAQAEVRIFGDVERVP